MGELGVIFWNFLMLGTNFYSKNQIVIFEVASLNDWVRQIFWISLGEAGFEESSFSNAIETADEQHVEMQLWHYMIGGCGLCICICGAGHNSWSCHYGGRARGL